MRVLCAEKGASQDLGKTPVQKQKTARYTSWPFPSKLYCSCVLSHSYCCRTVVPLGSALFSFICCPSPTTKEMLPELGMGGWSVSGFSLLICTQRVSQQEAVLRVMHGLQALNQGLVLPGSVILPGPSSYPPALQWCMYHSTEAQGGHIRSLKKQNFGAEEQVINFLL